MSAELPERRRVPLVSRLTPDHPAYASILTAHEAAIAAGAPGYADPLTGYFVFTAAEHWQRGTCCNSGCRHCPYAVGPRGPGHEPPTGVTP